MPTAFAPAKLNLYLHVGPPAADGFHPLSSLMVFADVGDTVEFAFADTVAFAAEGPFADQVPMDEANLVVRAARAIWPLGRGGRVTLAKHLPIAAGLGGGSSDAGATLRLLREAFALRLDDEALEAKAAALGSDGAACLWGRSVIAEGRESVSRRRRACPCCRPCWSTRASLRPPAPFIAPTTPLRATRPVR